MNPMSRRKAQQVCCICSMANSVFEEDLFLSCGNKQCKLSVHRGCYGIKNVGSVWHCVVCELGLSLTNISCELCPAKNGALKRTSDNKWAHIVCSLHIPEVVFMDQIEIEPIYLNNVPAYRFEKECYICIRESRYEEASCGVCIPCNWPDCSKSFHVTCGQVEGLLREEERLSGGEERTAYCGYCSAHIYKTTDENQDRIPLSGLYYYTSDIRVPKIIIKDCGIPPAVHTPYVNGGAAQSAVLNGEETKFEKQQDKDTRVSPLEIRVKRLKLSENETILKPPTTILKPQTPSEPEKKNSRITDVSRKSVKWEDLEKSPIQRGRRADEAATPKHTKEPSLKFQETLIQNKAKENIVTTSPNNGKRRITPRTSAPDSPNNVKGLGIPGTSAPDHCVPSSSVRLDNSFVPCCPYNHVFCKPRNLNSGITHTPPIDVFTNEHNHPDVKIEPNEEPQNTKRPAKGRKRRRRDYFGTKRKKRKPNNSNTNVNKQSTETDERCDSNAQNCDKSAQNVEEQKGDETNVSLDQTAGCSYQTESNHQLERVVDLDENEILLLVHFEEVGKWALRRHLSSVVNFFLYGCKEMPESMVRFYRIAWKYNNGLSRNMFRFYTKPVLYRILYATNAIHRNNDRIKTAMEKAVLKFFPKGGEKFLKDIENQDFEDQNSDSTETENVLAQNYLNTYDFGLNSETQQSSENELPFSNLNRYFPESDSIHLDADFTPTQHEMATNSYVDENSEFCDLVTTTDNTFPSFISRSNGDLPKQRLVRTELSTSTQSDSIAFLDGTPGSILRARLSNNGQGCSEDGSQIQGQKLVAGELENAFKPQSHEFSKNSESSESSNHSLEINQISTDQLISEVLSHSGGQVQGQPLSTYELQNILKLGVMLQSHEPSKVCEGSSSSSCSLETNQIVKNHLVFEEQNHKKISQTRGQPLPGLELEDASKPQVRLQLHEPSKPSEGCSSSSRGLEMDQVVKNQLISKEQNHKNISQIRGQLLPGLELKDVSKPQVRLQSHEPSKTCEGSNNGNCSLEMNHTSEDHLVNISGSSVLDCLPTTACSQKYDTSLRDNYSQRSIHQLMSRESSEPSQLQKSAYKFSMETDHSYYIKPLESDIDINEYMNDEVIHIEDIVCEEIVESSEIDTSADICHTGNNSVDHKLCTSTCGEESTNPQIVDGPIADTLSLITYSKPQSPAKSQKSMECSVVSKLASTAPYFSPYFGSYDMKQLENTWYNISRTMLRRTSLLSQSYTSCNSQTSLISTSSVVSSKINSSVVSST